MTGETERAKTQTGRTVSWEALGSLEVSTAFLGTGDAEADLGQRRRNLQLYLGPGALESQMEIHTGRRIEKGEIWRGPWMVQTDH